MGEGGRIRRGLSREIWRPGVLRAGVSGQGLAPGVVASRRLAGAYEWSDWERAESCTYALGSACVSHSPRAHAWLRDPVAPWLFSCRSTTLAVVTAALPSPSHSHSFSVFASPWPTFLLFLRTFFHFHSKRFTVIVILSPTRPLILPHTHSLIISPILPHTLSSPF